VAAKTLGRVVMPMKKNYNYNNNKIICLLTFYKLKKKKYKKILFE